MPVAWLLGQEACAWDEPFSPCPGAGSQGRQSEHDGHIYQPHCGGRVGAWGAVGALDAPPQLPGGHNRGGGEGYQPPRAHEDATEKSHEQHAEGYPAATQLAVARRYQG